MTSLQRFAPQLLAAIDAAAPECERLSRNMVLEFQMGEHRFTEELSLDEARGLRARLFEMTQEGRRLSGASPRASCERIIRDENGEIARIDKTLEY
jgi:hypothetical protein